MALTMQYVLGDVFGITITNWEGTPIKSELLEFIEQDTFNQVTLAISQVNDTRNSTLEAVTQSFEIGIAITFELFTLLTGVYILNFLLLMGVPPILLAGIMVIYVIQLGRAVIAYVRGV